MARGDMARCSGLSLRRCLKARGPCLFLGTPSADKLLAQIRCVLLAPILKFSRFYTDISGWGTCLRMQAETSESAQFCMLERGKGCQD